MKNFFFPAGLCILLSCNGKNHVQSHNIDSSKGLKEYYNNYFPIGVSVSPASLKTAEAGLIVQHFNSITAENVMKMGPLHPGEKQYYWKDADSIVAFAKRNKMKLRGHALIWHQQTPGWFFSDASGKPVTKNVLLQRIKEHITTVVSRYRNDVYAWDVVNEAIADDKDTFYRQSKFFQICGEEFIAKAFEWAHAADPDAILFYNDYNELNAQKRAKIIAMIRKLRSTGVPVHAIGLQAHWTSDDPLKNELEKALKDFSSLGLPLQITELDISVYPKEYNANKRKVGEFNLTFTPDKEKTQMEQYKIAFELFRRYSNHITGITFWNISDRHSWLDNFPVPGRKDYPLLFDSMLKPKKAFWEVVAFNPKEE